MDNPTFNRIIEEELKKTEVKSMIKGEIDSTLSSRAFEKKVGEIVSDVVNELFKILWQRNNFWKRSITK